MEFSASGVKHRTRPRRPPPYWRWTGRRRRPRFELFINTGYFFCCPGNIRSLEAFDRETTASYWLTVYAQDRGAIPLASRLDVYIEIVDVNDNVPLTKVKQEQFGTIEKQ